MQIEITTNPKEKDSQIISNGIIEFNKAKIPQLEPIEAEVKFSVFAKNETNDVVGGIRATCFWNTLHIELLWLSETCRGKGLGRTLIESAEDLPKRTLAKKRLLKQPAGKLSLFMKSLAII